MTPKTCDECGKVFSTKFCPECGRKYEDIKINIPVEMIFYIHGDKSEGYDICTEYNIDPESDLGQKIIDLNYEVTLIYEIVDNEPILRKVDTGNGQGLCDVIPIKK